MRGKPVLLASIAPTCGVCRHYRPAEDWGLCKRESPQAQLLMDENNEPYLQTFWPQVDCDEDACGRFEAGQ